MSDFLERIVSRNVSMLHTCLGPSLAPRFASASKVAACNEGDVGEELQLDEIDSLDTPSNSLQPDNDLPFEKSQRSSAPSGSAYSDAVSGPVPACAPVAISRPQPTVPPLFAARTGVGRETAPMPLVPAVQKILQRSEGDQKNQIHDHFDRVANRAQQPEIESNEVAQAATSLGKTSEPVDRAASPGRSATRLLYHRRNTAVPQIVATPPAQGVVTEPTIEVTIGRLEIRGAAAQSEARSESRLRHGSKYSPRALTLDAYLSRRAGGTK